MGIPDEYAMLCRLNSISSHENLFYKPNKDGPWCETPSEKHFAERLKAPANH
jgi:hypothetical protein